MASETSERIPTTGLGLALDEGLRTLAFTHSEPVLKPFISPQAHAFNKNQWDRFFIYSTPWPHSDIGASGPRFSSEGEPDIELTVLTKPVDRWVKKSNVSLSQLMALTRWLEDKLPGLRVEIPHEIGKLSRRDVLPPEIILPISRSDLIKAFAAYQGRMFQKSF